MSWKVVGNRSLALFLCLVITIGAFPLSTGNEESEKVIYMTDTIHIEFKRPKFLIEEGYYSVKIDACKGYIMRSGEPMLPFWSKMIEYPVNTKIYEVGALNISYRYYEIGRKILPSPEPTPMVFGISPKPPTEGSVYSMNKFYPSSLTTYRVTTGMNDWGDIVAHLFITLFPIRYNPISGEVISIKECDLVIRYAPPPENTVEKDMHRSEEYDVLAIAPSDFIPEMQRYKTHKSSMGFRVIIVSLDDVYNGKYFSVTGRDNAEKIKYFIKDALESWKIKYVVLVGDSDRFPIRRAYIDDIDGRDTPSDLYYGDIYKSGTRTFCSWDADNDNKFAESYSNNHNADGVDLDPDVSVGRLPASSTNDLKILIDKIINYERNVKNQPWFNNVVFSATDTFTNYGENVPEGEYTLDVASGYLKGFNIQKFYETKGTLSTSNIKNAVDKGCAFMGFSNHGLVDGVLYPRSGGPVFSSRTADSLRNGNKLPLSIQDACLTNAFDKGDCLGEHIVLNPNGGGIGAIGCSRIGYGAIGTYYPKVNSGYMDVHLYESFMMGKITPGLMLDNTKRSYITHVHVNDYVDFKTVVEYTLLGDPTTFIGGLNIEIMSQNATKWVNPGESVTYKVYIKNTGKNGDSVRIFVSGGTEGWKYVLSSDLTSVDPNSEVNVTLVVTASEKERPNKKDVVKLMITPTSTMLPVSYTFTTYVKRVYGMALDVNSSVGKGYPTEEVLFEYKITNKGNDFDNFTVSIEDAPEGWNISLDKNIWNISAWNESVGKIKVKIPDRCLRGTYYFNITCRSSTNITASHLYTVIVKRVYGLNVSLNDTLHKKIHPGGAAYYNFTVENIGNDYDVFTLSVEDIIEGWKFVPPAHLSLGGYESGKMTILIQSPNKAIAGNYTFKCVFSSEENLSLETKINVSVEVDKEVSLSIEPQNDYASTDTNSEVEFIFIVGSESNVKHTVYVNPSSIPEGWSCDVSDDDLDMEPYSQSNFGMTLYVPHDAPSGDYDIAVTLNSNIVPTANASCIVTVHVNQYYGLEISSDKSEETLLPGESARFKMKIKNTGNGEDTYRIRVMESGDVEVKTSNKSVMLSPGESKIVYIDVLIPNGTTTGDYSFRVHVTSMGDPTHTQVLKWRTHVSQVFDIYVKSYQTNIEMYDGDITQFAFDIINNGNGYDIISISSYNAPDDWIVTHEKSIKLFPGEKHRVIVNVIVPEGTEENIYQLKIVVSSSSPYGGSKILYYNISVLNEEDIFIGDGKSHLGYLPLIILVGIILVVVGISISAFRRGKRRDEFHYDIDISPQKSATTEPVHPPSESEVPDVVSSLPVKEYSQAEYMPSYHAGYDMTQVYTPVEHAAPAYESDVRLGKPYKEPISSRERDVYEDEKISWDDEEEEHIEEIDDDVKKMRKDDEEDDSEKVKLSSDIENILKRLEDLSK